MPRRFLPFRPNTTIGLDISQESIKFVKLKRKNGKYTLLSYGILPFSAQKNNSPEDQTKAISDILKELPGENKRDSVDIFTAVFGEGVAIRNITIPQVTKTELRQAVHWAGQKQLPFPLSEVNLEYKVLGEIKENDLTKKEILLVAALKSLINERIGLFNRSNLDISGISTIPIALWNLCKLTNIDLSKGMLVEIGVKFTNILIFRDNSLKLSREVLTPSDSQQQPTNNETSLSSPIDRLINEISRSFSFFQKRYPDAQLEEISLTGDIANLKSLPQIIKKKLGVEVSIINPFKRVKILLPPEESDRLQDQSPIFAVAMGLAIKDDKGINLLPDVIKRQKAINFIKFSLGLAGLE
ncbi:MAG: pilus assembly protein PilM [bacterium]